MVALLGLNAVQGEWRQALHHLPIFNLVLGITTAKAIDHRLASGRIRNPDLAALNPEIAIFAILGCLPASHKSLNSP